MAIHSRIFLFVFFLFLPACVTPQPETQPEVTPTSSTVPGAETPHEIPAPTDCKDAPDQQVIKKPTDNGYMEMPCIAGKAEGLVRVFRGDGRLMEDYVFQGGQRNGLAHEYYENGKLAIEHTLKNGQRDGNERIYFPSGILLEESKYTDGAWDGMRKMYASSGVLVQSSFYRHGRLEGMTKVFYGSGRPKVQAQFHEDLLKGEMKFFYESGRIQRLLTFKNGTIDGPIKSYTPQGRLIEEIDVRGEFERHLSRSFDQSVNPIVEFEFLSPTSSKTPLQDFSRNPETRELSPLGHAVEERFFSERTKDGVFRELGAGKTVKRECIFQSGERVSCGTPKS